MKTGFLSLKLAGINKFRRQFTNKTAVSLLCQHSTNIADAADGELVVVELVPRCGSGVHDVVAPLLFVL